MPMNRAHGYLCKSERWAGIVQERLLPWALHSVDLGDRVLEIGPGYGATTRVLENTVPDLTALELDPVPAARLRARGTTAQVVEGDGTAMPFGDAEFSAVVCFSMLHHIPSAELQDLLFAEAHRVLRPGGVFAGSDGTLNLGFRLLHLFDTMVVVDPRTIGERLETAGFAEIRVDTAERVVRFKGVKP